MLCKKGAMITETGQHGWVLYQTNYIILVHIFYTCSLVQSV